MTFAYNWKTNWHLHNTNNYCVYIHPICSFQLHYFALIYIFHWQKTCQRKITNSIPSNMVKHSNFSTTLLCVSIHIFLLATMPTTRIRSIQSIQRQHNSARLRRHRYKITSPVQLKKPTKMKQIQFLSKVPSKTLIELKKFTKMKRYSSCPRSSPRHWCSWRNPSWWSKLRHFEC